MSIPAVLRWGSPAHRIGRSRGGVAQVFLGQPAEVAAARRWAATLASVRGADPSDASLVASELVTNAITHTRCGQPGGIITLALTSRLGRVTLHVHDLGTSDGEMPTLSPAATGQDGLAEGNRGLQVVAALGLAWGTRPAVNCPVSRPSDLAASVGGCCTWCILTCQPHQHGGRGRTSKLAAGQSATHGNREGRHTMPDDSRNSETDPSTVPEWARETTGRIARERPEDLPYHLDRVAEIEAAKQHMAEHPPAPCLLRRRTRDFLHLCAVEAWRALASGQPAPDLDPAVLEQEISDAFGGSSPVDELYDDWLQVARERGIPVNEERGDILPAILETIIPAITAAFWSGLTTGHFTITRRRYSIPRQFLPYFEDVAAGSQGSAG